MFLQCRPFRDAEVQQLAGGIIIIGGERSGFHSLNGSNTLQRKRRTTANFPFLERVAFLWRYPCGRVVHIMLEDPVMQRCAGQLGMRPKHMAISRHFFRFVHALTAQQAHSLACMRLDGQAAPPRLLGDVDRFAVIAAPYHNGGIGRSFLQCLADGAVRTGKSPVVGIIPRSGNIRDGAFAHRKACTAQQGKQAQNHLFHGSLY